MADSPEVVLEEHGRWSEELVDVLIDLYRSHTCLYDIKAKNYHNREMKRKAIEDIAKKLNKTSK